jgi:hypothetical protein
MRTITIAQLITDIRNRADMTDTSFVTDTELTGYIHSSATELYDIMVQKWGDDYFIKSASLTLTNGETEISLPSDFYKLKGIDLVSGSQKQALRRFMFEERNKKGALRYRLMGDKVQFLDDDKYGDKSLLFWYVPTYVNGSSLDGINGYEEYVVLDVMIKILSKEQSEDVPTLINQKMFQLKRVEDAASNRDASQPSRVNITRNVQTHWDWNESDDENF